MARRNPPRKVTYFEPVAPRLARNSIIEFDVRGRPPLPLHDADQLQPARPRRGDPASTRSGGSFYLFSGGIFVSASRDGRTPGAAEQSAAFACADNSCRLGRKVRLVLSRFRSFGLPALRRIRVPAKGNPRRRGGEADLRSGFAENPGDLANGNPIDLGDLAERHTVFYQGADAQVGTAESGAGSSAELLGSCRSRFAATPRRGRRDYFRSWRRPNGFPRSSEAALLCHRRTPL